MTKQTTLNSANPYQAGEAYAINEMVYYNGGVRIVLNTLASGSTAAETDLGDVVSDVNSSTFRVRDSASPTKKLAFDVSAVTAGQVRTLTMPDANVTLGVKTLSSGTVVAVGGTQYNLVGNTTLNVNGLSGPVMVVSSISGTLTIAPGGSSAVWTETGTSLAVAGASYALALSFGEAVLVTPIVTGVAIQKISRALQAEHTFLKSGSYRVGFATTTLTADRTMTLPNSDVDLRYLPRSNADTGNALSGGGATIIGTNMTLSTRQLVLAGDNVSSTAGGASHCVIGVNHPSLPGNGETVLNGSYCGFLVTNNTSVLGGPGAATRCAGGVVLRSSIEGTHNWFGNVDRMSTGASSTDGVYHLVRRSTSNRTATKLQTWESVHGMEDIRSEVPVHGASLFTSLMGSTSTSSDKTLICKYALSTGTHSPSTFLTVDGSQNSTHLFLPPAALGKMGVACHEVVFVLRETTFVGASSHAAGGAAAICKRRINVYHDTSTSSSIEVEGTDFLVGGATSVSFTVDLVTGTFSVGPDTWTQPLLKITPVLMVSGTPIVRSAAAKVISTYIINVWDD